MQPSDPGAVPRHGPDPRTTPPGRPAGPVLRRRRIVALALATVLAGAVAGGTAGWVAGSRSAPGNSATGAPSDVSIDEASSPDAGTDPLQALPSLVATIEASVVDVDATLQAADPFGRPGTAEVAGSGFVYTADGLIATNAHVVDGATGVTVTFTDGGTHNAEIVGTDTDHDLALLHIDATGLTPLPLATDLTVAVGDFVIVAGNALALEGSPTVSVGVISALDRNIEVDTGAELTGLIQTDAAISSGDSGGPLLTASGAVIGINTATASSTDTTTVQNIGFAVPIATAAPILDRLGELDS